MDDQPLDVDRDLLDNIGPWTQRKHDIIQYYAEAYSEILTRIKSRLPFRHMYIDGFAGAGVAIERATGELVQGSPLLVLTVRPPFDSYAFVEIDPRRAAVLQHACERNPEARIIIGDANVILPHDVFPGVRYDHYERAFCLLDPYKLNALRWETVVAAARSNTIDLLIHFPIMDINRSCPRDGIVADADALRISRFWGSEAWRDIVYTAENMLPMGVRVKASNEAIFRGFSNHLKKDAGFRVVEGPIPMRNSRNAMVYALFFASQNIVARRPMLDTVRRFADEDEAQGRPSAEQTTLL